MFYAQTKTSAYDSADTELTVHYPLLAKGLWIVFWATIAGIFPGILVLKGMPEGFVLIGNVLSIVLSLVQVVVYFRLRVASDYYRNAAVLDLVLLLGNILKISEDSIIVTLITIIVSIIAIYHEFHAHADVVARLNVSLSEKWRALFKWMIVIQCATLSIFILAFIPLIGLLLLLAVSIGTVAMSIIQVVYLYDTAQAFRNR